MNKVALKTEHGGEITIDVRLVEDYVIEGMCAEHIFSDPTVSVGWTITLVLRDGGRLDRIPITNLYEVKAALATSSVAGTERWA